MSNLDDRISESWSNISRLFEKNSNAEQELIKTVFNYAYRAGFNTGYSRGITDDIIYTFTGGEKDDNDSN